MPAVVGEPDDRDPLGGAPRPAAACLTPAEWERVVETAGESLDAGLLAHLRECPGCAGRFAAIAATWSREDIAAAWLDGAAADPAALAIVERLAAAAPPAGPATPPPAIEGLEDLVEIGRGGMGIVYRARDRDLGRTVAVKVLATGAALSAEGTNRARREARLLARVAHPNIVRVHSVVDVDAAPAIVMEWVDGPSLAKLGRDERMPLREAIALVRDLAAGVAAVHAAGIVHRDIKPANVLVAPASGGGPGVPKLVDFGLARPEGEAGQSVTVASVAVGTPAFMAPEQTGIDPAAGPIGPATDIHGLGAVLYWLLSGRAPYEAASTAATLRQAAEGAATPISALVPRLPADVATIVATCLERSPQRRYRSAEALADDLTRFLDGRPILARRAGFAERSFKWARRRPVAAAVLACGTIAAAAALAAVAHHARSLAQAGAAVAASRDEARVAAELARESFTRLTDSSAKRFLARGDALDPADRDYLRGLRDRYREWPLEPDPEAALHFRAAGLYKLTDLFEAFHWKDDAVQAGRDYRACLDELERRGIATPDETFRRFLLERRERGFLVNAGRLDEAVAETRASIARLEPRVSADPALERHLAAAWGDLGNLEGKAGRLAESRAAQEKALAMFDRLVAAAPFDAGLSKISLTILYNASINPAFRDDPPARRAILTTLVDRGQTGLERFPAEPVEFGRGLLLGLATLANADLAEGKPEEALAKVERRIEAARRLVAEHPREAVFRDDLISAAVQQFHCLRALGRPGDARADLEEAEAAATEAAARDPALLQRAWVLVEVLAFKAMLEEATGRQAAALAGHRRLLEVMRPWVKDDGSPEPFPIKLAEVKAQIERLEAEEARAAAAANGNDGETGR